MNNAHVFARPVFALISILLIASPSLAADDGPAAARPQGQPESQNAADRDVTSQSPAMPNMVLLYYGFDKNGARDWDADALRYYLGYYTQRGTPQEKPVDTLFDTVLWMYRRSERGRLFETSRNFKPTQERDWRECLDRLFLPDRQLSALETAAADLQRRLGRPVTVQVVLTLPYPDVRVANWAETPDGTAWDFRNSDGPRLEAVQWYIRQALKRWEAAKFDHLRLLGLYWFNEGHVNLRDPEQTADKALRTDLALLHDTARFIHTQRLDGRPLTLSWIPYSPYGQDRLPVIAELMKAAPAERIDYLMIQPNYFFARWKKQRSDLVTIVRGAASVGAGVEIECDESLVRDEAARQRLMDYLEVIPQEHPHWKDVPAGYYQGLRTVHALATRPELARQYEALYQFVKVRRDPVRR